MRPGVRRARRRQSQGRPNAPRTARVSRCPRARRIRVDSVPMGIEVSIETSGAPTWTSARGHVRQCGDPRLDGRGHGRADRRVVRPGTPDRSAAGDGWRRRIRAVGARRSLGTAPLGRVACRLPLPATHLGSRTAELWRVGRGHCVRIPERIHEAHRRTHRHESLLLGLASRRAHGADAAPGGGRHRPRVACLASPHPWAPNRHRFCAADNRLTFAVRGVMMGRPHTGRRQARFSTKRSSWRRLRASNTPSEWIPYSPTIESPVSQ